MKSFILVVIAMSLMLIWGCATETALVTKPDWVAGESASYSSAQYLIGRGQAATQGEAQDQARADLAKIFQVDVAASSEDVQTFKTDATGTGAGQFEGQATRRITTHTDQIVRGIQIAELWQDPGTLIHYALAVLPRLQAMASLRQQINELDDATRNHIEQSKKQSDLFLKIAAARRAVDTQVERLGLQKSLQVLDPTGVGPHAPWEISKLISDLDEIVKRVKVASQVSIDSPHGLGDIVAGALANAGFMIETGQNPDFILQARMNLTDLGFQDGWYWQRGNLEIILTEAGSGRVRGTKIWPIKSSGQDAKSAIRRALDQANAALKKELAAAIIVMAGGQ